jgi:hypothetical protein
MALAHNASIDTNTASDERANMNNNFFSKHSKSAGGYAVAFGVAAAALLFAMTANPTKPPEVIKLGTVEIVATQAMVQQAREAAVLAAQESAKGRI